MNRLRNFAMSFDAETTRHTERTNCACSGCTNFPGPGFRILFVFELPALTTRTIQARQASSFEVLGLRASALTLAQGKASRRLVHNHITSETRAQASGIPNKIDHNYEYDSKQGLGVEGFGFQLCRGISTWISGCFGV